MGWVEKDADVPHSVKRFESQGDEKSRPNGIKGKSLFHAVSWSFPSTVSLKEIV